MIAAEPFRRQWRLYQLLSGLPEGETLADLADLYGVSSKTIQRDLATLREVGLKVVEISEKFGLKRWRVELDTARIPKLQWDEAAAIYLGRRFMEPMAGSLFWEASQKAFAKLKATFTSEALDYLDSINSAIFHTSVGVSNYSERAGAIDALMIAIEDRVISRINYHSLSSDGPQVSEVLPLGFVYHEGSLYLVAVAPAHDQIRHYKVDRVYGVENTRTKFIPPDGFSLEDHLAHSFGVFHADEPLKTVRIRFAPEAARYVQEGRWHATSTIEPLPDGSVICQMQLADLTEVRAWTLSFGPRAEALEPPELREAIKDDLRRLQEVYT